MPSPPNVDVRRRVFPWFTGLLASALLATSASAIPNVSVGPDNVLRVDGQAFFPVGLLQLGNDDYPDWNDRIRQSGANAVWEIGYAFADSTPSCAAIRDSADATGYKILVGAFDTWEWDNKSTPELEVAVPMYPADSLQTLLDCFAQSDAVIAIANRDEHRVALRELRPPHERPMTGDDPRRRPGDPLQLPERDRHHRARLDGDVG